MGNHRLIMNSLEALERIRHKATAFGCMDENEDSIMERSKELDEEIHIIKTSLKALEIIKKYIELDTFINTSIIRFKRDLHIVAIPKEEFDIVNKELEK